jgi:hypothetical protein
MKKSLTVFSVVTLIFVFSINLVCAEEDDCLEATVQGKLDAETYHRSGIWFVLGLPAVFMGPFWMIGAPIAGYVSSPTPKTLPDEETNIECYIYGYREVARHKNGRAAIGGVAVGGGGFIVVFVVVVTQLYSGL